MGQRLRHYSMFRYKLAVEVVLWYSSIQCIMVPTTGAYPDGPGHILLGGLSFCSVSCTGGYSPGTQLAVRCGLYHIGARAKSSYVVGSCDRAVLTPAHLIAYVTAGIPRHTRHGLVYLSHTSSPGASLHTPLLSYFNSHFLTAILHFIFHFRQ